MAAPVLPASRVPEPEDTTSPRWGIKFPGEDRTKEEL